MGCAISCCAEGGPAWLSFVHGFTFVWRTSVLGGHASSLQRDNVALLRGRSNGCEKRLVSGNWRRKTERATLDRNYVLCILLEQGQRCSSNTRASPSTFLFEHILFVRAALWLTDFTGWISTACQQTGPSTQPLGPPAMFDPHAIRYFSGSTPQVSRCCRRVRRRGSRGDSSNALDCTNTKLTKLLKLNLNSHRISGG